MAAALPPTFGRMQRPASTGSPADPTGQRGALRPACTSGPTCCADSASSRPQLDTAEVTLEGGAHRGTCAVKQHTLVAFRPVEGLARLVGGPAVDVAQGDDEPLRRGEKLDR